MQEHRLAAISSTEKPTAPEVAAIQKDIWRDRNNIFCAVNAALSNKKKEQPVSLHGGQDIQFLPR